MFFIKRVNLFHLVALPYFFSPFVYFSNAGGQGLFVSTNVFFLLFLTAVTSLLILYAILNDVRVEEFSFVTFSVFIFFVLLVFFAFFSSGYERQEAIIVCFFMLITLNFCIVIDVLKLSGPDLFNYAAKVALIVGFFMGVIGVLQSLNLQIPYYYINYNHIRPIGVVQHINVHAVLMVFFQFLLFVCYVHRAKSNVSSTGLVFLLYLCVVVYSFNIGVSGSRVALLCYVFCFIYFFVSFRNEVKVMKSKLIIGFIISIVCVVFGFVFSDVLGLLSDKAYSMSSGSDIRLHLYKVSYGLIVDMKPWGYGVGSFQQIFQNAAANYQLANDYNGVLGSVRYTHPHNELLYWLIQIGYFGFIPFALFVFLLWSSYFSSHNVFNSFVLLLIPFALHMMLELPFHLSYFTWYVFIFLLFFGVKDAKKIIISVSDSFARLILCFCFLVSVVSFVFVVHSGFSLKGISEKVSGRDGSLIGFALNNYYFSDTAYHLVKRDYIFMEDIDVLIIKEFINYAERRLEIFPDILLFSDLMEAYYRLSDFASAYNVYSRALFLYPEQPLIKKKWFELMGIEGLENLESE